MLRIIESSVLSASRVDDDGVLGGDDSTEAKCGRNVVK